MLGNFISRFYLNTCFLFFCHAVVINSDIDDIDMDVSALKRMLSYILCLTFMCVVLAVHQRTGLCLWMLANVGTNTFSVTFVCVCLQGHCGSCWAFSTVSG